LYTEVEDPGALQIMLVDDQEAGRAAASLNLQKMKGAKNMPAKLTAARRT
jgi:hypothetical protein